MRFKIKPKDVFKFPEDAIKWATAHGLKSERSSALDMFVSDPRCYVDIKTGIGRVVVSYIVIDVSKEQDNPPGTSTAQAKYYAVFLEQDNKRGTQKFRFQ